MPKRRRRRRNSTGPRRTARPRRAAFAVAAAAALLAGAFVPDVRAAAGRWTEVVAGAVAEARLADPRHARTAGYALHYSISLELAREIERAAVAEGIDPDLAFRLVQVESGFRERAVSPAGALGLAQLMPATADWLQPGITREEIFHRETNLRLGMRYLRLLLRTYDGRVDEALHAYNRGPGTVDRIRALGGDPANGYADRVLGRGQPNVYRGSGYLDAGTGPAVF